MDLGQLRITFADPDRTKIKLYEWMGVRWRRFQAIRFDHVVLTPAPIGKYRPRRNTGKRRQQRVKDRPGQLAFKRRLMLAYGGRCCITGCDVAEALDAAHIDPFENESHDHPTNGLLLRKDLHALFDQNLLAVHPVDRKVRMAHECLAYSPYRRFHNSALIATPVRGFETYSPDPRALKRRWRRFHSAHSGTRGRLPDASAVNQRLKLSGCGGP
jgi:hypothetical protein